MSESLEPVTADPGAAPDTLFPDPVREAVTAIVAAIGKPEVATAVAYAVTAINSEGKRVLIKATTDLEEARTYFNAAVEQQAYMPAVEVLDDELRALYDLADAFKVGA